MSNFENHGKVVTDEDLIGMGIQPPPDVPNLTPATVEQHEYTVDDNDTQQCYFITQSQLAPMYIDNPIGASAVQPDVWTLETDNEYVTLTYRDWWPVPSANWRHRVGWRR